MKRTILSLLTVLTLTIFNNSVGFTTSFDPSSYTFLTVASPYSSHVLYFPTINNSGEIVGFYLNVGGIGGNNQLVSTVRGELTPPLSRGVGSPEMNDSGEVVYITGRDVYSTTRGYIAEALGGGADSLGLNNLGEVSYSYDRTWPKRIGSSVRGTVMQYDESTGVTQVSSTDINDSGEIVATIRYGAFGTYKIVSSVRGKLLMDISHQSTTMERLSIRVMVRD